MNKTIATLFAISAFFAVVSAECPNACSAHGKCGAYDMCTCFRNWMSNDCSERICQFGLAHVDTPKGDLDASSGKLSGPDDIVITNNAMYPYGTTEQYPAVTDIDGNVLTNTAHEYRECSNKGICDRSTGTCTCFEGYDGSACQRASCPVTAGGVCSGHGTCESISEISARDFGNIYKLWDEDATMGCVCDGGYTGPDCSQRECKYGFDPYYKDNERTVRYSNFTYSIYTEDSSATISGNYSLIFYDSFGEDWQTAPIAIGAECSTITAALEGLPNKVIPNNTVRCYKLQSADLTAVSVAAIDLHVQYQYILAFPENPGKLKQIAINKYLDGTRPTLYTDESTSTLGWHIYSDGFIGEDVDMVPDRCYDVMVTLAYDSTLAFGLYLDGLDTTEVKLLKKCLGDGNGDSGDNTDVYNWDYGDHTAFVQTTNYAVNPHTTTGNVAVLTNPHLIRLQEATQYQLNYRTDSNGVDDYDPIIQDMPKSVICDTSVGDQKRFGVYNDYGFCANHHAPGFYAVLWYDHDGGKFRLFANSDLADVYDTTTPFYVYTTTGYLQLVNPHADVYTAANDWSNSDKVKAYYTNTLYSTNTTSVYAEFHGDLSCENNPKGTNGALDCLNKDDYVMILSTDNSTSTDSASVNPNFHNIYQVKRIGFINRVETQEFDTTPNTRQQIVLDYTLNTRFIDGDSFSTTGRVYKFYPPTSNADGGYRYAAPCSNRGLCNQDNGLCECFNGFSGDNCGCINNLSY